MSIASPEWLASHRRIALGAGLLIGAAIVPTLLIGSIVAAEDAAACRGGDAEACETAAIETLATITMAESMLIIGGYLTVVRIQAHTEGVQ